MTPPDALAEVCERLAVHGKVYLSVCPPAEGHYGSAGSAESAAGIDTPWIVHITHIATTSNGHWSGKTVTWHGTVPVAATDAGPVEASGGRGLGRSTGYSGATIAAILADTLLPNVPKAEALPL